MTETPERMIDNTRQLSLRSATDKEVPMALVQV